MTFKVDSRVRLKGKPALSGPGFFTLAKNAGAAVVRNAIAAAKGNQLRHGSPEQRLAICEGCRFFQKATMRCLHKKCGCKLKFKTWLAAEKCPDGKW